MRSLAVKYLIQVYTTDHMLIAEQIVSILSTLSLIIILIWIVINLKKENSFCKPTSITCIISILCFTLFACINISWMNVLYPISSLTCHILFPLGIISYNVAKIAMYWCFTFQAETIFKHSTFALNTKWLWIYRIISAIMPCLLWSIWIYQSFIDIKPHKVSQYSHCFPTRFRNINIVSYITNALTWTDISFSGFIVAIFVYKLYQITNVNIVSNNSLLSPIKPSQKWINTIRKSTFLCIVVTLSIWIYVFASVYILKQCVLFIAFDGVINALCLSFLFNFSNEYYNKCCKNTFEICCIDIIFCCNCKSNNKNKKYKQKQSMGGISMKFNSRDGNDFSLGNSSKDDSILMNKQLSESIEEERKNNNEIDDKNESILDLPYAEEATILETHNKNENIYAKEIILEVEKNEEKPELKNENINRKNTISNNNTCSQNTMDTSIKSMEYINKNKNGSFSNSNDSDANKSVEFMLLDMTDDENNMNDDYGYYEQDEILKDKDEKQVTDHDDTQDQF